ncbi:MAG: hypothetical protein K2W82_06925 [Candidatus Obscuribacterales bacterium]|nr:hypothetical protein [Candidatus Obscuribacterales bacterium]
MKDDQIHNVWNVALPWSDGSLSARLWQKGKGVMVSVPELDIACYGKSQSEAVLRLFSNLLKYHNELKAKKGPLNPRQESHFAVLKVWVKAVERKMCAPEPEIAYLGSRRAK